MSWPIPGIAKMDSMITLPPMRPGRARARIVITGSSALRNACLLITTRSERPLARAVCT